ncbi:hypothetical protein GOODEAATRI_024905 [Goodea atripinnis]|uniref:Uncharacterized protein n=1 Tax=Goodea atripinnis TaxID=208336 RepID=A0ABV0N448_9TELE
MGRRDVTITLERHDSTSYLEPLCLFFVALHGPTVTCRSLPSALTPPLFSCLPPTFLFLFLSEVSNREALHLSRLQSHNVGYVKAVTPLLAGPLTGYKRCECCQGGEGSHYGECVCVLVGGCLSSDTDSRCPRPDAGVKMRLLVKHSTLPQRSEQPFLLSLPRPSPFQSVTRLRLSTCQCHRSSISHLRPSPHLMPLHTHSPHAEHGRP